MSKFTWYINRLRSMSIREVFHRIFEKVKKIFSTLEEDNWSRFKISKNLIDSSTSFEVDQFLKGINKHDKDLIIERAESIMNMPLKMLGQTWEPLNNLIEKNDSFWSHDPKTKRSWPHTFTFKINYKNSKAIGEIKYAWELNRLQFLQPVALSYAITNDKNYLIFIEKIIDSWFENNPPLKGISWNSGIEISLRSLSLIFVYLFVKNNLSEKATIKLHTILKSHYIMLKRFPSKYSSANNHLISELTGMYVILSFFPKFDRNHVNVIDHLKKSLESEYLKQIYSDGSPAEQSPSYGAFSSELCLVAALVAHINKKQFSKDFYKRLESFGNFIYEISEHNYETPNIGDNDDGRVITDLNEESSYPLNIANSIFDFLNIIPPKKQIDQIALRSFLFKNSFFSPKKNDSNKSVISTFRKGGLSLIKSSFENNKYSIIFDHGPLGYLSIAAHGHADALSFCMNINEHPVFIDPGTYLYHSGFEWRDWFRGTSAHNTACINYSNQSTITGSFNWSKRANIFNFKSNVNKSDWSISASHDGYKKKYDLIHNRDIRSTSSGICITDYFIGKQQKNIEINFQLHSKIDLRRNSNKIALYKDNIFLASLILPEDGNIKISKGEDNLDGGWVSYKFGEILPAYRISWNTQNHKKEVKSYINFKE